ncbi:MAG: hypothetical protein WC523_07210 [Patescibacteria group bacterium]|jgi:hypothetical protein
MFDMKGFQYEADYNYFLKKLAKGNKTIFKKKFLRLFDFRDPKLKRKEFNFIRNKIYKTLVSKYGEKCQLRLHDDCSKEMVFAVDHYIPLLSNELNKKIRKLKAEKGKKILSQSFGSNDISNLRIACKRCNDFKKHRIIIF